ncbi:MAG: rhodanese-like domain-containing protein [Gammaproteobacteria bacterium]|jgi:phage shock protein E|nr:rhodanese-like domain-containing protein [Gammaproteobacteria bacterium]
MILISSLLARTAPSRLLATAALLLGLSFLASCASTPSQVVWLDVRTDAEYAEDHIAGSAHIPHEEIALRIADLGLDKDTEIRVYCRSGRRAGIALAALEEMGYTNATNVGGLSDARELED